MTTYEETMWQQAVDDRNAAERESERILTRLKLARKYLQLGLAGVGPDFPGDKDSLQSALCTLADLIDTVDGERPDP